MSAYTWKKKTPDHWIRDQQRQYEKLVEVVGKHHLIQMVEV